MNGVTTASCAPMLTSGDVSLHEVEQPEVPSWDRPLAGSLDQLVVRSELLEDNPPGKALVPFDARTGRPIDDVWARWLALDPVRMAARHADSLRTMRGIYLDAGRHDEFYLDLAAQALSDEL